MKIKEAQEKVDKWIKEYSHGYWKPNNMMLRLMEETGELARAVNLAYGEKPKKNGVEDKMNIEDELGDVFFTLTCIANSLNIDMEKSFSKVMAKYNKRDKARHLRK